MSSGAMQSNVGNSQVYEAGDQRRSKQTESNPRPKNEEGPHKAYYDIDSKDERSIGDTLAAVEKHQREEIHKELPTNDPLAPAQAHGNEPSRGAKIDAELQAEDEEMLRKKGKA